jgi:putative transposase
LGERAVRLVAECRPAREAPSDDVPHPGVRWPAGLVERRFTSARPDAVWVADFEHVATWSGTVHVAFVLDAHSRRIPGWREASSMRAELVLDALEQAIRAREGVTDLAGLVHHTNAGSQGGSIAFTERLAAAGTPPSVGSVGDALGNVLAESDRVVQSRAGPPSRPWKELDDVEPASTWTARKPGSAAAGVGGHVGAGAA